MTNELTYMLIHFESINFQHYYELFERIPCVVFCEFFNHLVVFLRFAELFVRSYGIASIRVPHNAVGVTWDGE